MRALKEYLIFARTGILQQAMTASRKQRTIRPSRAPTYSALSAMARVIIPGALPVTATGCVRRYWKSLAGKYIASGRRTGSKAETEKSSGW